MHCCKPRSNPLSVFCSYCGSCCLLFPQQLITWGGGVSEGVPVLCTASVCFVCGSIVTCSLRLVTRTLSLFSPLSTPTHCKRHTGPPCDAAPQRTFAPARMALRKPVPTARPTTRRCARVARRALQSTARPLLAMVRNANPP